MKTLLLLAVLLIVPVSFVTAQTQTKPTTLAFAGLRYDDAALLSVGVGTKVTGNIWSFTYTDIGYYGSLATEIALFQPIGTKGYVGLLAGPNVDWQNNIPDGNAPVTYIVGASGVIAGYDLNEKMGLYGFAKYKFAFDNNNFYQNGSIYGGGLHVWF